MAENRATLLRMIEGERTLEDVPVRFDPALNRAIDYAAAERLVKVEAKTTGSVVSLLPSGRELAERTYKTPGCMEAEKGFFDSLRGRLPEVRVKELLDWEADS